MSALAWGLPAIVLVALAQVPGILYLARHVECEGEEPPPRSAWADAGWPPKGTREARDEAPSPPDSASPPSDAASPLPNAGPSTARPPDRPESPGADGRSGTRCPHCDTANDPVATYCQGCVGRLG
ncbi:hypothetical protein BRC90_11120 [Halobacteriales archaeon QS_4_69_34]|nr:MAG: hypothetical protein BRC90_11120 [Halobacteriales archaeon QS_4_69_34]